MKVEDILKGLKDSPGTTIAVVIVVGLFMIFVSKVKGTLGQNLTADRLKELTKQLMGLSKEIEDEFKRLLNKYDDPKKMTQDEKDHLSGLIVKYRVDLHDYSVGAYTYKLLKEVEENHAFDLKWLVKENIPVLKDICKEMGFSDPFSEESLKRVHDVVFRFLMEDEREEYLKCFQDD